MRGRGRIVAARLGLAVLALGMWEIAVRAGWVDAFFFSRPLLIGARVGEWFAEGSIWPHLGTTLIEALLAFAAGTLLGIGAGFLLGRAPVAAEIMAPFIQVFNALPRVVLAPLFLLWFGLGIGSKVALGVTLVFFVVFFNTFRGVREASPLIMANARLLGASERDIIRHVQLPSALGWIFSSLETSLGFAIIGAVVGEYLGAARGVGYLIAQAEGVFDTTGVFAGMTVLSAVVLAAAWAVGKLERWLLRWKEPR